MVKNNVDCRWLSSALGKRSKFTCIINRRFVSHPSVINWPLLQFLSWFWSFFLVQVAENYIVVYTCMAPSSHSADGVYQLNLVCHPAHKTGDFRQSYPYRPNHGRRQVILILNKYIYYTLMCRRHLGAVMIETHPQATVLLLNSQAKYNTWTSWGYAIFTSRITLF